MSDKVALLDPTKDVCTKFREAFTLFSKCHNTYNGNVTDDATIKQLGKVNSYALEMVLSIFLP